MYTENQRDSDFVKNVPTNCEALANATMLAPNEKAVLLLRPMN